MKVVGGLGTRTVQLRFRKAQGFNTTVTLPAKPLGVDAKAVIADVSARLSDPKAVVVVPGSLDKYDPKKLAAAAVGQKSRLMVGVEAGPEVQPAMATLISLPAPKRRTFGKR